MEEKVKKLLEKHKDDKDLTSEIDYICRTNDVESSKKETIYIKNKKIASISKKILV